MWTVPEGRRIPCSTQDCSQRLLNKLQELPNLLWLFGGIQARVQAMRLGKLCLSGLGVVEAEQSHPQVIVCMGKCRVEAQSFAVTGGGILKFPCVEQCSAEVESYIHIIRFQRNQFFVGGNGIFQFVGGQLARAEPDERVRKVWLLREGFFVIAI